MCAFEDLFILLNFPSLQNSGVKFFCLKNLQAVACGGGNLKGTIA
jgi:hypothetical protein